jgi:hypothetical protein
MNQDMGVVDRYSVWFGEAVVGGCVDMLEVMVCKYLKWELKVVRAVL